MIKLIFAVLYVSLNDGPYTLLENGRFFTFYYQENNSNEIEVTRITEIVVVIWAAVLECQLSDMWYSDRYHYAMACATVIDNYYIIGS